MYQATSPRLRLPLRTLPHLVVRTRNCGRTGSGFVTAELSEFSLDQALEAVVATRVQLSVGDDPSTSGSGTCGGYRHAARAGATGPRLDPLSADLGGDFGARGDDIRAAAD